VIFAVLSDPQTSYFTRWISLLSIITVERYFLADCLSVIVVSVAVRGRQLSVLLVCWQWQLVCDSGVIH